MPQPIPDGYVLTNGLDEWTCAPGYIGQAHTRRQPRDVSGHVATTGGTYIASEKNDHLVRGTANFADTPLYGQPGFTLSAVINQLASLFPSLV